MAASPPRSTAVRKRAPAMGQSERHGRPHPRERLRSSLPRPELAFDVEQAHFRSKAATFTWSGIPAGSRRANTPTAMPPPRRRNSSANSANSSRRNARSALAGDLAEDPASARRLPALGAEGDARWFCEVNHRCVRFAAAHRADRVGPPPPAESTDTLPPCAHRCPGALALRDPESSAKLPHRFPCPSSRALPPASSASRFCSCAS